MPIRVMPEALASRVAAGEVVERPASVVKELVENSLDAGAGRIDIEIEGGGVQLIRVTDDGHGIPADELALAFARFATSKADQHSDLTAISTLGFRGEALPSIASVADVTMRSKHVEAEHGAECNVAFGSSAQVIPSGTPNGTSVQVRQLFRNVPVRRKFLGSVSSESARVTALVSQIALIRSDVKFRLQIGGNIRISTPGDFDDARTLAHIHRVEHADSIVSLHANADAAFSVAGAVGLPSIHYSRRTHITVAVNERLVHSYRMGYAVERAYQGFLPDKRFPMALVKLKAPLEDVDVNVHPAKTEVRFKREGLAFSVIEKSVRETLNQHAPVRSFSSTRVVSSLAASLEDAFARRRANFSGKSFPAIESERTVESMPDEDAGTALSGSNRRPKSKRRRNPPPSRADSEASSSSEGTRHHDVLPRLKVLGQAQQTYIIAADDSGVFLIDQHAAHERVKFEEIRAKQAVKSIEAQPLLEPYPLELNPHQLTTFSSGAQWIADAGWHIEPFGGDSLLLRAVPQMIAERTATNADAAVEALMRVLDDMAEEERGSKSENMAWGDRLLATMACHSAVRAGDNLTQEECEQIVQILQKCEHPQSCPHGRPTMLLLSGEALEREFGRR